MTNHRPTTTAVFLVCVAGAAAVNAADWRSGSTTYHPGATTQSDAPFGPSPGYDVGTYRPHEYPGGQWQAAPGTNSEPGWAAGGSGQRGAQGWSGQPQGYLTEPGTGRPLSEYRFRQRAEDKVNKADDAPRYRPDPELSRRSQQFWGVPGQSPSEYGGAPGAVFRPLRPEQETSSKPVAPTPRYAEPGPPPSWSGYPGGFPSGYGYPY